MYQAMAVRLNSFEPHPNADRLKIATVNGFTIIVGIDTPEGAEGLFFSTESPGYIETWFLEQHNLLRKIDESGKNIGGMFEPNGRVKSVKIRGVRSDGFFFQMDLAAHNLKVGQLTDELDGKKLCAKYINPETLRQMQNNKAKPLIINNALPEHFDTENLRNVLNLIPAGATIVLTEKLHGTSGRTGLVESAQTWWQRLLRWKQYAYVTGSRKVIVIDEGNINSYRAHDYHGDTTYRIFWHDEIAEAGLHYGEVVFYEIVGYTENQKPIMSPHQDGKETIVYNYGCEEGHHAAYVYRIIRKIDGVTYEYDRDMMVRRCRELNLQPVPELGRIIYDGDMNKLVKYCLFLTEGKSTLADHIREGVVLDIYHADYRGQRFIKQKGTKFCDLEGIMSAETWFVDEEAAS